VIEQNCLFSLDRYNCGGDLAKFYLILSYIFTYSNFFYLILLVFIFNKINLIISFLKTACYITTTLKDASILMITFVFIFIL